MLFCYIIFFVIVFLLNFCYKLLYKSFCKLQLVTISTLFDKGPSKLKIAGCGFFVQGLERLTASSSPPQQQTAKTFLLRTNSEVRHFFVSVD